MEKDPRLLDALDFILNSASEAEVEVVFKAVERRRADFMRMEGLGVIGPLQAAKGTQKMIEQSMGLSLDSIRDTVRGFVADMIVKEAPDIPQKDLDALLEAWIPEGGKPRAREPAEGEAADTGGIPPDALIAMIKQFMSYSTGSMSASEQTTLWESMDDWADKYWNAFPERIRRLISACLKGRLDPEVFWKAVMSEIGI
jgi:hypothetical protein